MAVRLRTGVLRRRVPSSRLSLLPIAGLLVVLLLAGACGATGWSAAERAAIASLTLDSLPPLPPDPSNAVADSPAAVTLGRALFVDGGLSASGAVSCASCHQPERFYTDGRPVAQGEGAFHRNSMTLLGAAHSPWQTWDGKADSQWSQALLPLENRAEHGIDRLTVAHAVAARHTAAYEALFGPLPPLNDGARFPAHGGPLGDAAAQAAWASMAAADQEAVTRLFVNVGKALAAFQRTLAPSPSRFDRWAATLSSGGSPDPEAMLSRDEQAGLRLFLGKAQCIHCHNGPLLTNNTFHNTGVPPAAGLPLDRGRAAALESLAESPFTCLGALSDADPNDPAACGPLRFVANDPALFEGAFRTPTLRNVAETGPYMHAGQFASLADVLAHYNAGGAPSMVGHNELAPLHLRADELAQLEAFLRTLTQTETPPLP
jgi:cytochrome c peroxidase